MSWLDYYRLLVKYQGDLSKAERWEMLLAKRGNPNDPVSALYLAQKKYAEEFVPF